jgi:hypothetical protein
MTNISRVPHRKFSNLFFSMEYYTCCIRYSFADPDDVLSTPTNVDQTYMDVGWGGVRTSSLPFVLELGGNSNSNATPSTTRLKYEDVNDVDYLDLCKFGETASGRAAVSDLKQLGGYTTFVDGRLLVNQTLPHISLPCRKPIGSGGNCTSDPSSCMVGSCTASDIRRGYTRMNLRVAARSHPQCVAYNGLWNDLVVLQCAFHDVGFGHTFPTPESLTTCAPWAEAGLFNAKTKVGINIANLRHWSYFPRDGMMHFAVYSSNKTEAVSVVNSIFDNTRGARDLAVEIRPVRRMLLGGSVRDQPITLPMEKTPSDYDPSVFDTFTFVYGDGKSAPGNSRRRVGSTEVGAKTRDYTVCELRCQCASSPLLVPVLYSTFSPVRRPQTLLCSSPLPSSPPSHRQLAWARYQVVRGEDVCQSRLLFH